MDNSFNDDNAYEYKHLKAYVGTYVPVTNKEDQEIIRREINEVAEERREEERREEERREEERMEDQKEKDCQPDEIADDIDHLLKPYRKRSSEVLAVQIKEHFKYDLNLLIPGAWAEDKINPEKYYNDYLVKDCYGNFKIMSKEYFEALYEPII